MESLHCIHVGDQEGLSVFLYHRAEENLSVLLVQVYFGADTDRTAIPYHLYREFITEQASPILRRTSGRQ